MELFGCNFSLCSVFPFQKDVSASMRPVLIAIFTRRFLVLEWSINLSTVEKVYYVNIIVHTFLIVI